MPKFTTTTGSIAGKKGGKKRAEAFTREYQQAAANRRATLYKGSAQLAEWGRLGATLLRTKYTAEDFSRWGRLGALKVIKAKGIDHYIAMRLKAAEGRVKRPPNPLEKRVINELEALGLAYQREVVAQHDQSIYTVDLVLQAPNGTTVAIQVHGEWWHSPNWKRRTDRRKRLHMADQGWCVLTLWERATEDPFLLGRVIMGVVLHAEPGKNWVAGDPMDIYNNIDLERMARNADKS